MKTFFSLLTLFSFLNFKANCNPITTLVANAQKEQQLLDMEELLDTHDSCGIVASVHIASIAEALQNQEEIKTNLEIGNRIREHFPKALLNSSVPDALKLAFNELHLNIDLFPKLRLKALRKSVLQPWPSEGILDPSFEESDLDLIAHNRGVIYMVLTGYDDNGRKLFTHAVTALTKEQNRLRVIDPDQANTPIEYFIFNEVLSLEGIQARTLLLRPSPNASARDSDLHVHFLLPIMLLAIPLPL